MYTQEQKGMVMIKYDAKSPFGSSVEQEIDEIIDLLDEMDDRENGSILHSNDNTKERTAQE